MLVRGSCRRLCNNLSATNDGRILLGIRAVFLTPFLIGVAAAASSDVAHAGGCLVSFLGGHPCHEVPTRRAPVTTATSYPICFYDVELGAVATAKAAWPNYSGKIIDGLNVIVRNRAAISVVSSRTVVVRTTAFRHRQVREIWPEIACIGQSGGETSLLRRRICVSHIRNVLSKKRHDDSSEPVCQTFLD